MECSLSLIVVRDILQSVLLLGLFLMFYYLFYNFIYLDLFPFNSKLKVHDIIFKVI